MSPESPGPLWDLQRFYFFGLRTYENRRGRAKPSPAQLPWPWLAFALADMFIQMNINSLYFVFIYLYDLTFIVNNLSDTTYFDIHAFLSARVGKYRITMVFAA